MSRRVLVVEDDRDIAHLLELHLRDLCSEVVQVFDGEAGLAEAQSQRFDLIILDLTLPRLDGLDVCRRLRAQKHYTPILMLTARSSEADRVLGLDVGADDYLTKPFGVLELVARVKAMFRRMERAITSTDSGADIFVVGDLRVDVTRREVRLCDRVVELTAKEFDLLAHFAQHPGRVYTRGQLLDLIWGYGHDGYEHTVNSHINRLRAKIESNPAAPRYILTVWGIGYKFADTPASET
ncbi:MAG: response regulator transcription factor [Gammaproteobacteria bacterium]